MNPSFLDLVQTHIKESRLHSPSRVSDLRKQANDTQIPAPFLRNFERGAVNIIAEIKYASPSEGAIFPTPLREPEKIAFDYLSAGAKALSVLTEPHWFQGDESYIPRIRKAVPEAPVLMKDFYIAEEQFYKARLLGANAVLLIAAMLSPNQYCEFHDLALSLGLTPLTEIHNEAELVQVLPVKPALLGINNRNLKTLKTDLNTGIELRQKIDSQQRCVCESGIENPAALRQMQQAGFDSFLIGTGLMRSGIPGLKLREFLRNCEGKL